MRYVVVMSRLKSHFYSALNQLAETAPAELPDALSSLTHGGTEWRVSNPINEAIGLESALENIWSPLKTSFPDLERRDSIFIGGRYEGRDYIAAVGHYCGTFHKDWLTIPANNRATYIRYGEVYQIRGNKIVQANLIWDVLDVIRQAGFWPLAPSLGVEEMWAAPKTGDGISFQQSDPVISERSIAQTLAMHKTLFDYDNEKPTRDGLLQMDQRKHWHPKMMWYGPAGIGTTRGLDGFVDGHQLPFRQAFQRPQGTLEEVNKVRDQYNAGHYVRFGDGDYSVTSGWPSIVAAHSGGGFAGTTPTDKKITMRVMDFYHHQDGLIRENWVPIDMLDMLHQMDFDVMHRMQHAFQRGRGNKGSI